MLERLNFKNTSPRDKLRLSLLSAFFCALCSVLAQIAVPTPFGVSFTLQSLAVMLCGFILPPFYSFLSVVVYILLGILGIPVFSGFSGGISHLFSFSGGFILGFIVLALLCSLSTLAKKKALRFTISFSGLLICYVIGILWFCFVTHQGIFTPFLYFSLIFLVKDTLLLILTFFILPFLSKIKVF